MTVGALVSKPATPSMPQSFGSAKVKPLGLTAPAEDLLSRVAGYEDTSDAERLAVDAAMRHVVDGRATEHTAARFMRDAGFAFRPLSTCML